MDCISKRGIKSTRKKLIGTQRLNDTLAQSFPGGVIAIMNRKRECFLIDGNNVNEIDLFTINADRRGAIEVLKVLPDNENIKQVFEGENVSCDVRIDDNFYEVSAIPLHRVHHKINEVLCVIQNITEQKCLESELLKALDKEKELGVLKSRFVTMASHEFRTPLSTILSSTFLLENYTGENYDKEKKVHTNRIKRAVNNLTMILNEFLSLEKLENNKVRVIHSLINVQEYIQDLISEMEVAKKEGQIITYNHLGSQNMIQLDHQLLWSIITNLISNALKYSKAGSEISISSEVGADGLMLHVRDNGIGIPAEERKYIFERFYRASNATNFEGTGLGLHIVQKYVHLLRGEIQFESRLDEGTHFNVILPPINKELFPINNK
jgi:signal transduction histidine kinase